MRSLSAHKSQFIHYSITLFFSSFETRSHIAQAGLHSTQAETDLELLLIFLPLPLKVT